MTLYEIPVWWSSQPLNHIPIIYKEREMKMKHNIQKIVVFVEEEEEESSYSPTWSAIEVKLQETASVCLMNLYSAAEIISALL